MAYNAEAARGEHSISVACNVPADGIAYIVERTHDIPGVDSYVIGGTRTTCGDLPRVVDIIRNMDETKKIIYDHQKAGTCDPEIGIGFAIDVKKSGVDSVVLFPLGDPDAQKQWIQAAADENLEVVVGPDVNIRRPLGKVALSQVLHQAANLGVRNFWLRYDTLSRVQLHAELVDLYVDNGEFSLYITRAIDDEGHIKNMDRLENYNVHYVIGRAIFAANDIRESAKEITNQLLSVVSKA